MTHLRDLGRRAVLLLLVSGIAACSGSERAADTATVKAATLRGSSSYTPYDAYAMLWTRAQPGREMVWVGSGGEAGRLLVSASGTERRPDWILCTQGVVAGLVARGEKVVIIGTTYVSDQVLRPVRRLPHSSLRNSRSLFIPRSSIEFAFDRFLQRENLKRTDVKTPTVQTPSFSTIASLLTKPANQPDALDWAILVDPFITNVIGQNPGKYELGAGGLYEIHYSIVVRADDLATRRAEFVELLRQMADAERQFDAITDTQLPNELWGRQKDGKPETLPTLITYDRKPSRLELRTGVLHRRLTEELQFLTSRYPNELRMPNSVDALVDASLLREVAPARVLP